MGPVRRVDRARRLRRAALALALAMPVAAAPFPASALPADVQQALERAQIAPDALAVVLQEAGTRRIVYALNERRAVNPASLAKLVTTAAALDLLSPSWSWSTPVWLHGSVRDGVLDGSLAIKGSGDPKLVVERVWQLLRRVQQLGVRDIRGDILLDSSAFARIEGAAGDFDGETARPYNVRPDALLLNFKAVTYTFTPDAARGVAVVGVDPLLAGSAVDATVPLAAGPCHDWRAALKASLADPSRITFAGAYPAACGEQSWPVADAQPASYNRRLVEATWRELGGRLGGTVRDGAAPIDRRPSFEWRSPPLLDAVRDINKFSNNVMAEQLFLTLALTRDARRPATPQAARELLRRWLAERAGVDAGDAVIDNGSGLSRDTRLSAHALARVLQTAFDGPWMAELMSSLPIVGVDGTLRRATSRTGRAHLKTGSLRDVVGVAGYVLSASGRRYVLVAIVNHAQAQAARPAIDAIVQWALRDARTPATTN